MCGPIRLRPNHLLWVLAAGFPFVLGCGDGSATPTSLKRAVPETESTGFKRQEPPPADPVTTEPAVKLTADEYLKQTTDNQYDFIRRYFSKVVELSGRVELVKVKPSGETIIRPVTWSPSGAVLELVASAPNPLPKVQPGQSVVLRGVVRGGTLVPDWHLISVTGDPPAERTAEVFAKEFEADEDATRAKRAGKFFILAGEIEAIDLPGQEARVCTVRLKAPGAKGPVTLVFPNGEKDERVRNAGFRVGQAIRVVGECDVGTNKLVRCSIVGD